ncbi:hypothetical protein LMQOC1_30651 [Listeria monocytogenes QOC1]|nr:hypothetical protein LMQOC1_30651 [Listeria monocytogenes QOC1]
MTAGKYSVLFLLKDYVDLTNY